MSHPVCCYIGVIVPVVLGYCRARSIGTTPILRMGYSCIDVQNVQNSRLFIGTAVRLLVVMVARGELAIQVMIA